MAATLMIENMCVSAVYVYDVILDVLIIMYFRMSIYVLYMYV